jgi:putative alpha-1,2-mannosidase
MILKKQYHNGADGLGGNDDCGQMSAWYILSSLGFYPIAPSSDQYAIGSPSVDYAVLKLENGNEFIVDVKNQSEQNVYVSNVILNGKRLNRLYITYNEIMQGGTLIFNMSSKPAKN